MARMRIWKSEQDRKVLFLYSKTEKRKENSMTEQTVKEIIKSFAYGLSAKEISDNEGTSLETMEKFAEEHAAEIEQKKAELKEGGWYE